MSEKVVSVRCFGIRILSRRLDKVFLGVIIFSCGSGVRLRIYAGYPLEAIQAQESRRGTRRYTHHEDVFLLGFLNVDYRRNTHNDHRPGVGGNPLTERE